MLPVSAEEQTLASVTPVCIIILQILSCCVCIITFLNKKKVFIHVELWVVLFFGVFLVVFFSFHGQIFKYLELGVIAKQ